MINYIMITTNFDSPFNSEVISEMTRLGFSENKVITCLQYLYTA